MLNDSRKNFVTASQAHMAMAGYEHELAGRKMDEPNFDGYSEISDDFYMGQPKPKVGELKDRGVRVTGKQIDSAWKYLKAIEPVFSTGMETVAREIAMGNFIEQRDEGFTSKAMAHGNEQELESVTALGALVGVDFSNIGDNQNFFSEGSLGVTPDGVEYNGFDVESCAEVKNPIDTTHFKYVLYVRNQTDLLKIEPKYFWQCQCGLAVTGAKRYHWMSYHKSFCDKYKRVYVCVERDEDMISLLKKRADKVLARANEIIEELIN